MVKLTKADVLHVAKLAKLTLRDDEVERYGRQLSEVLKHVEELTEVDTSGIEPTSQTTGLENVYRQDQVMVGKSLSQDQAVSGTDEVYNGYFKVAAILSERSDK